MDTRAKRRTLYQARHCVKALQLALAAGALEDVPGLQLELDTEDLDALWDKLDALDSEVWFRELVLPGSE